VVVASIPASKLPGTVGELVRQRLREIGRTSRDLADAVGVPVTYIDDLIAGSRRPPLPARTDIYAKMTSFLRLSRNDVTTRASAERASVAAAAAVEPGPEVRTLLLDMCEPSTARTLKQRRAKRGGAEVADFFGRLLEVAQSAVRRSLDDQIGLRLAAAEYGSTYADMRFRILEFLDVTPDTLTADDLLRFVRPRIARWDVDFKTGVLRVVLQAKGPRDRTPRADDKKERE
jgi:hypothetical protein